MSHGRRRKTLRGSALGPILINTVTSQVDHYEIELYDVQGKLLRTILCVLSTGTDPPTMDAHSHWQERALGAAAGGRGC
jgi:hypothetical protein